MKIDLYRVVPERYHEALTKALQWKPRSFYSYNDRLQIEAVISGDKPLAYEFYVSTTGTDRQTRAILKRIGNRDYKYWSRFLGKYGVAVEELERSDLRGTSIYVIAYRNDNADLATLFVYAHGLPMESAIRHYLQGVILGYPLNEVTEFVQRGIDTRLYRL